VLEQARALLRDKVAFYDRDRYFAPDIEAANALLLGRSLSALLPAAILPSYA
jgi:histidine ammonia-lyase